MFAMKAMVILLPEQRDGYATDLEQGEADVSHSLETFCKDVAR